MASRNNIIPKEQMTPYQRWELASFDEAEELPPVEEEHHIDEPPPPPALTAEELDAIREQARQEGYAEGQHQGLQAGRQEGYMAGLQQGQQEVNETIQHLRQIAVSFGTEVSQCSENMAPELLNLGLDLSKAMLKTVIKVKPELILPTISAAIHSLPSLQLPALLYLHPADATLVRENMGDDLGQHGWRIVEDPELDRGGCRIETGTNQVDATTQTRWRRIAESLSKQLDWLE
ncbi:flagellar biosynthesis/type III secretory pathway protein [Herbaspirillum sp. CF444]|uniref:flagellar assembly protein FliH n=1 Tax=Herbaspirillum sp. CF444 TaxID=1144319 RepID=UPI0002726ED5|nr:flagellar assembly protein FliH [Herbaspirillum sp. CF444]EJL84163.1 flagellar biosynthesis/type III secretory pathway protein [Herbaspirillum sp. CF444]